MKVFYWGLILLSVPIVFCGRTEYSTAPSDGGSMGSEAFPSAIGSTWTYEWEDRQLGTTDTVVVSVIGQLADVQGGPAKIWVFEHSDYLDTVFMTTVDDTIRFLADLTIPWVSTKFVFPLQVGVGWRGDFATDTSWVEDRSDISVSAGDFSAAFRVEEKWSVFNSSGWITTWIVPGVGIVMEDRQELHLGSGPSYVRRLIDYSIVAYHT